MRLFARICYTSIYNRPRYIKHWGKSTRILFSSYTNTDRHTEPRTQTLSHTHTYCGADLTAKPLGWRFWANFVWMIRHSFNFTPLGVFWGGSVGFLPKKSSQFSSEWWKSKTASVFEKAFKIRRRCWVFTSLDEFHVNSNGCVQCHFWSISIKKNLSTMNLYETRIISNCKCCLMSSRSLGQLLMAPWQTQESERERLSSLDMKMEKDSFWMLNPDSE